jgi:hypothetical protein
LVCLQAALGEGHVCAAARLSRIASPSPDESSLPVSSSGTLFDKVDMAGYVQCLPSHHIAGPVIGWKGGVYTIILACSSTTFSTTLRFSLSRKTRHI